MFKEELRELREQPTDPQAQQELINSIEEVYFSSDSFDIVKYELEVRELFGLEWQRFLMYTHMLGFKVPNLLLF